MKNNVWTTTEVDVHLSPQQRERIAMIDPVDLFTQGHEQGQKMVIDFINKFCDMQAETAADIIKEITKLRMELKHD